MWFINLKAIKYIVRQQKRKKVNKIGYSLKKQSTIKINYELKKIHVRF